MSELTALINVLEDAIYEQKLDKVNEILETSPGLSQDDLNLALGSSIDPDGDIRAMAPLFARGAKVNHSAFRSAMMRKDLVAWQAFIDQGWDINSKEFGDIALRSAVYNEEHVKWFLDHGVDPSIPCARGWNLPMLATNNDPDKAIAILKLLLSHGAELDPKAAMFAMERPGGLPIVKFLIEEGMDVNVVLPKTGRHCRGMGRPGSFPRTLLLCAVRWEKIEIVKFLSDEGADKNLSPDGFSATDCARNHGCTDIYELLSNW
ncbi:ankyrin [Mollisia scopiformis]|uniref:Ankyrin n=1 Tax=Mollisia scopiformis TaxID=149040 RepID=A0A194X6H5_MOLSC|nr:ankyrin [Mollisia scopiformis]KUJ15412.1 ankyrin [Mollisia scopiformis]